MPAMAGRAIRITSRIVFFVCGLISLFTAVPYALLRGVDLPYQSEWVIFVVALALVGISSVALAVLPCRWIAKLCKRDCHDLSLFLGPLRVLGGFAAISYVLAVIAYLAPHSWNLNQQLMLALCPMSLVRMTFDPSPVVVFLLLAPMNAAVYGSVGLAVRYVWLAFQRRRGVNVSG